MKLSRLIRGPVGLAAIPAVALLMAFGLNPKASATPVTTSYAIGTPVVKCGPPVKVSIPLTVTQEVQLTFEIKNAAGTVVVGNFGDFVTNDTIVLTPNPSTDGKYTLEVARNDVIEKTVPFDVKCAPATTPPPTSTTPTPTEPPKVQVELTWVMPGSTGAVIWPQYTPAKWLALHLQPGFCQVDRLKATQAKIDAVTSDGKLTQGEDAALLDYSRPFAETGKPWKVIQPGQGECPAIVTPTPTPTVTPTTPTPTPTVNPPIPAKFYGRTCTAVVVNLNETNAGANNLVVKGFNGETALSGVDSAAPDYSAITTFTGVPEGAFTLKVEIWLDGKLNATYTFDVPAATKCSTSTPSPSSTTTPSATTTKASTKSASSASVSVTPKNGDNGIVIEQTTAPSSSSSLPWIFAIVLGAVYIAIRVRKAIRQR